MADLNQGSMYKKYLKQHKKRTNCKSLKLISSGQLNIVNNLRRQFNYSNFKEGMTVEFYKPSGQKDLSGWTGPHADTGARRCQRRRDEAGDG